MDSYSLHEIENLKRRATALERQNQVLRDSLLFLLKNIGFADELIARHIQAIEIMVPKKIVSELPLGDENISLMNEGEL